VALIAAFSKLLPPGENRILSRDRTALLAYAVEAGVAGVPCGLQDQLAAAFGGVHAWYWPPVLSSSPFRRVPLLPQKDFKVLQRHLLLCYCGIPHESKDINGEWVRRFLEGRHRDFWEAIIANTHRLENALAEKDFSACGKALSAETELRLKMTPHVLNPAGRKLFAAAKAEGCGARFTGAGGGGCLWAIGEADGIDALRIRWEKILSRVENGCLLPAVIAGRGVL